MGVFRALPLQLRRQISLRQEAVGVFAKIKGVAMIPTHESLSQHAGKVSERK
jgi:hypothetical protein